MSLLPPNTLLDLRARSRGPLRRLFTRWWANRQGDVAVRIHGFDVVLNGGNNYPLLVQDHRWFNAPVVELCHEAARALGRPLTLIDVGTATGDTVLLLKNRCPGAVEKFFCIEGDDEFYRLAVNNLSSFKDVQVVKTMLASENREVASLVKHHLGTAAAIGDERVRAARLDSLPELQNARIDLLKVDVDGFDGEVLAGATAILRDHRPAVIFEWHPKLLVKSGNEPLQAFRALAGSGYNRCLWFTNTGLFSHFSPVSDEASLQKLKDYLLAVNARGDEHFDVIALHETSVLDEGALARLEHARSKADCR